jgi:hypothetical protein
MSLLHVHALQKVLAVPLKQGAKAYNGHNCYDGKGGWECVCVQGLCKHAPLTKTRV